MDLTTIVLIVVGVIIAVVIIMFILSRMKGKVELILDKYEYSAGDTITGKIILKLKKPVHAKSLNIGLIGEKNSNNYYSQRGSVRHTTDRFFEFTKPLAGEGDYPVGERTIDFQLKIPNDVLNQSNFSGIAGTLVKSVQLLSGNVTSIKWFVTTNLDIPGIDISKRVQVSIS